MKKLPMIERNVSIESALLMATRSWLPPSSPFVYQDPNARSLLITQRSRPLAAGGGAGVCPGAECLNPSLSATR